MRLSVLKEDDYFEQYWTKRFTKLCFWRGLYLGLASVHKKWNKKRYFLNNCRKRPKKVTKYYSLDENVSQIQNRCKSCFSDERLYTGQQNECLVLLSLFIILVFFFPLVLYRVIFISCCIKNCSCSKEKNPRKLYETAIEESSMKTYAWHFLLCNCW